MSARVPLARRFLAFAGACLAVVLLSPPKVVAAPPNIILLMTDDQGYGDLSVHGNPELRTPHLDRLHAASLRFTDFHVAPMCTPTRGQLLTGIDALRNGAMNVSSGRTLLRTEFPTLATLLRAGGYRTGVFGKWHLGDNHPYRPEDRGFDETLWLPSSHTPSAADYWNNDYFDDVYRHNGVREAFSGYCTDVFFEAAKQWMRACHERGQRFFCYLPTNAPHGPLFVPDRYREPYRHLPRPLASFFGMIANIDENVGRLEAFLRETGLREDTLLIFLTDNGTATGETVWNVGMRGKKISLYDGGHRVPLFVRWPGGGLRPPGDLPDLTAVQDVVPTVLELCGIEPPAGTRFDGVSLAGLLRGEADRLPDRKLVVQFSRMNRPQPWAGDATVLWNRWRLVNHAELYHIGHDPGQTNDLAAAHPEVVQALRSHYAQWWAGVAPRVNEFSPITVGADAEPQTMLTPCDWQDTFLDQQAQIRRGERKNGDWAINVARPGVYEFQLRRWPYEADTAIATGLPSYQGVDGTYPAGATLAVAAAGLRIGDIERTAKVRPDEKTVTLHVRLPAGRTTLRTWFADEEGEEICGAYYVYARWTGP
ncbi:MAG: arylsulfatase [Verrucomicrobiales bacterium]|nr:arylsulfatase [Verrucomicrobiales bacterium]MCP5525560.1 arylsulfatase [Verrucomicrobiales bacterium]